MAELEERKTQGAIAPFEVRVDGARHGAFTEVRDAVDAAQIVKRERPQALVAVHDASTGQILVEPDA